MSSYCFHVFISQLDESKDFEERKMIRAAMRDLRKRKRGNGINDQSVALNTWKCLPHSAFYDYWSLSLIKGDFYCTFPDGYHCSSCLFTFRSKFAISTLFLSIPPSEAMLGCTQEEIGRAGWCAVCVFIVRCLRLPFWMHRPVIGKSLTFLKKSSSLRPLWWVMTDMLAVL